MRTTIYFALGPTNVGKSTLLKAAGKLPDVGLVEVGNMMRAKYLDPASPHYQPDYFKGDSSPKHTAIEAWKMMEDGIENAIDAGKHVVFVDGQPRDIQQCDDVYTHYECMADKFDVHYLNLFAQLSTRMARAERRDSGDQVKLALSAKRMEGDCIKLYEVISRILIRRGDIISLVTDHYSYDHDQTARELVALAHRTRSRYDGDYTRPAR